MPPGWFALCERCPFALLSTSIAAASITTTFSSTFTTTFTTTTFTTTTKRVRTQQPDGGWSAPVSVPCEPRLVVTAATTSEPAAARAENHLPKLRGFRNSEVRMAIAGFVGVRPAVELGRLRAARDVVAALPEEEVDY